MIRIATELLKERSAYKSVAGVTPEPVDPVDCTALLNLIQAAQEVYTEHCPIAKPTPTEDTQ